MQRLLALSLSLAVGLSQAQDMKTGSCNLSMPGTPSKESFLQFDNELRHALEERDVGLLSLPVNFPLRVNGQGANISINNPSSLQVRFNRVFTGSVRRRVLETRLEEVFCNYSGIMYGSGQVWISVPDGRYRITTVNNSDTESKDRTVDFRQCRATGCSTAAHIL